MRPKRGPTAVSAWREYGGRGTRAARSFSLGASFLKSLGMVNPVSGLLTIKRHWETFISFIGRKVEGEEKSYSLSWKPERKGKFSEPKIPIHLKMSLATKEREGNDVSPKPSRDETEFVAMKRKDKSDRKGRTLMSTIRIRTEVGYDQDSSQNRCLYHLSV